MARIIVRATARWRLRYDSQAIESISAAASSSMIDIHCFTSTGGAPSANKRDSEYSRYSPSVRRFSPHSNITPKTLAARGQSFFWSYRLSLRLLELDPIDLDARLRELELQLVQAGFELDL